MERNRRWTGPDIKPNVFRAGNITNFGREAGTFLKIPIRACFGRRDTKAATAPGPGIWKGKIRLGPVK